VVSLDQGEITAVFEHIKIWWGSDESALQWQVS